MIWVYYEYDFRIACTKQGIPIQEQNKLLYYAKYLYDSNLPIIFDANHLSCFVGYNINLLYSISNCQHYYYRKFFIQKKNGKQREINEPYTTLKEIQYWILNNLLENIKPSIFAKAYIKNGKLTNNVKFHKKQNIVIKIDIVDFFQSISAKQIFYLIYDLGYTKSVASLIANLCCLNSGLPQGAPTSPYLSNLFAKSLDKRIGNYVISKGYRYTRYSDDITISGDIDREEVGKIISTIKIILKDFDLSINKNKLRVLRNSNRQVVTGIIVNNRKLSISREVKKKIRQEVYYIDKYGLDSHIKFIKEHRGNYLNHLRGKVNWVLTIEKNNDEFKKYKDILSK